MDRYARSHLADQTLLRSAETNAGRERASMADLLADIAEIDVRELYLPAAYPSMYAYSVGRLRMSEDAGAKRIHAARAARRFPAIFAALADGRLHLSAVCLLAPHLTEDTAAELLAAATHKTKAEIERLLAERFPRPDLPTLIEPPSPQPAPAVSGNEHAPGHVDRSLAPSAGATPTRGELTARRVEYPRVTPLSAQSFGVQFTLSQSEHDMLQHAQELLPGDVREVFVRALKAHVRELEKRKFAATDKPSSACPRPTRSARHIPAPVRRAVWKRDGGQCTFVSDTGHRCPARRHLQFDHILEVARGGEATVSGIRLLCWAHNQHAAERTFGVEFMTDKRRAAQRAAAEKRAAAEVRQVASEARVAAQTRMEEAAQASVRASAAQQEDPERDVTLWLRALGFNAAEARRAEAACEAIPDDSLEERVRFSLSLLRPPHRRLAANGVAAG